MEKTLSITAYPIFAIIDSQWFDVVPDPVTGTPTFKKPKISD